MNSKPVYITFDLGNDTGNLVMPDALSKTVPIWCTVINRTLFPEAKASHAISFPPEFLPESEESQIEGRIDGFVQSLKVLFLVYVTIGSKS